MKLKINNKELKTIALTLGCWGLLFIGSGIAMTTRNNTVTQYAYTLGIHQSKVAASITNEIKLKEMSLEVNLPLSVDVRDYLENVDKIDQSVLKSLKLDTSNVNTQEAGTYTYTITYKKKKFNGVFKITEKELPKVNLTLRNLKILKDTVLDTNLSTYIIEALTDEVKNNIVLDLSAVKTNQVGTYQYTVTYNNKIYTATIEIYAPQAPTVITPNNQENQNKENTENKDSNTNTNTNETTPNTTP